MEEAWYPRPKLPPKGIKVKCFLIDFVEDYEILHLDSNLHLAGMYAGGGEFVHGTFEVRLVCAVQAHPLAQVVL